MMAKRKRQLAIKLPLLEHDETWMASYKCQLRKSAKTLTLALFPGGEYEGCSPAGAGPYELPDEIAYNAKRKKEGLFVLNPEEEETNVNLHGAKGEAHRRR